MKKTEDVSFVQTKDFRSLIALGWGLSENGSFPPFLGQMV
jgi:hypothetical protein